MYTTGNGGRAVEHWTADLKGAGSIEQVVRLNRWFD